MGTLYYKIDPSLHEELRKYAKQAVEELPWAVKNYFEGTSALQDLVGHAMKASKGSINPSFVGEFIVVEMESYRGTPKLNTIMRGGTKKPRTRRDSNERDDDNESGSGCGEGHAGPGDSPGEQGSVCGPGGVLEEVLVEGGEGDRSGHQPEPDASSPGSDPEEQVGLSDEVVP